MCRLWIVSWSVLCRAVPILKAMIRHYFVPSTDALSVGFEYSFSIYDNGPFDSNTAYGAPLSDLVLWQENATCSPSQGGSQRALPLGHLPLAV